MNVTTIITVLGVLLTILLAAAGAVGTWAALKVGRNAQTLTNYRESTASWKERSEAQEAEITGLREEVAGLRGENAELRGQMTIMRELFRSAISELASSTSNKEIIARLESLVRGIPTGEQH